MVYVPKQGEKVRVTAVDPTDFDPRVSVGDVVTVESVGDVVTFPGKGFFCLWANGVQVGTWCTVEPVVEELSAPIPVVEHTDWIAVGPLVPATALEPEFAQYHPTAPVEATQRVEGLIATDGTVHALDVPPFMSTDSAVRKLMPVASGVLAYFPDALMCVAWVSRAGNDKHNPGEPLHWAKAKSADEPDAEARHMLDHFRGLPPDPGLEPLGELGHLASKAWRALAHLQRACDAVREGRK
jgi:hypothetical protein